MFLTASGKGALKAVRTVGSFHLPGALIRIVSNTGNAEDAMAVEGDVNTDIQAHVKSYDRFSAMMKWGTIISFIVAMIVVIIISS